MTRTLLVALLALVTCGCTRTAPSDPAQADISQAAFEPVDRAAKAVRAATGNDVSLADFRKLLLVYAAELSALSNRPLAPADQALLPLYRDAFDAYDFSLALWEGKLRRQTSAYGGDKMPVQIGTMKFDELGLARKYEVPLEEETMPSGVTLIVVPSNAAQLMWTKGAILLSEASARYEETKAPAGQ
jgi:hypothetical protein